MPEEDVIESKMRKMREEMERMEKKMEGLKLAGDKLKAMRKATSELDGSIFMISEVASIAGEYYRHQKEIHELGIAGDLSEELSEISKEQEAVVQEIKKALKEALAAIEDVSTPEAVKKVIQMSEKADEARRSEMYMKSTSGSSSAERPNVDLRSLSHSVLVMIREAHNSTMSMADIVCELEKRYKVKWKSPATAMQQIMGYQPKIKKMGKGFFKAER